jgi:hypothetical protein
MHGKAGFGKAGFRLPTPAAVPIVPSGFINSKEIDAMKKVLAGLVAAAAVVAVTGCVGMVAPVVPPTGLFYTDYKAPLDYNQNNSAIGSRSGKAETFSILWLVALGDASIKTAASNGSLTTITGADYEYFNVAFGAYQKYTTVVHGE